MSFTSYAGRKAVFALLVLLFAAPAFSLSLSSEPMRIVSLGGGITEILYRLELDDKIVGVDATSVYPEEALKTKPDVGYVRTLGAEGILSLKPTLVLADQIAGPADTLALIEQAGVRVVRIPEGLKPEDIKERIRAVSDATGTESRGRQLLDEVEGNIARVNEAADALPRKKKVLFVLSASNGKVMVGGTGTSIDHILKFVGADNAASSVQGWKPFSEEGIISSAPDTIIMMNHGPAGAPADIFSMPAFAATPAAQTRSFLKIDGPYLLNYGPRTPVAAMELLSALNGKTAGKLVIEQ